MKQKVVFNGLKTLKGFLLLIIIGMCIYLATHFSLVVAGIFVVLCLAAAFGLGRKHPEF